MIRPAAQLDVARMAHVHPFGDQLSVCQYPGQSMRTDRFRPRSRRHSPVSVSRDIGSSGPQPTSFGFVVETPKTGCPDFRMTIIGVATGSNAKALRRCWVGVEHRRAFLAATSLLTRTLDLVCQRVSVTSLTTKSRAPRRGDLEVGAALLTDHGLHNAPWRDCKSNHA